MARTGFYNNLACLGGVNKELKFSKKTSTGQLKWIFKDEQFANKRCFFSERRGAGFLSQRGYFFQRKTHFSRLICLKRKVDFFQDSFPPQRKLPLFFSPQKGRLFPSKQRFLPKSRSKSNLFQYFQVMESCFLLTFHC